MAHINHRDDLCFVINLVQYAILALGQAKALLGTLQLFRIVRAWIVPQLFDTTRKRNSIFCGKSFGVSESLFYSLLDAQLVQAPLPSQEASS